MVGVGFVSEPEKMKAAGGTRSERHTIIHYVLVVKCVFICVCVCVQREERDGTQQERNAVTAVKWV